MLEHYLLMAWLSLRRSPLVASVNVLTLALGLFCFILAASITAFWGRAEQHFAKANRIVVMTSEWRLTDGSQTSSGVALPLTNDRLAYYLKADFPRIETVARVTKLSERTPVKMGDRVARMRGFAADAQFLEIFDLPFIEGDPREALRAPGSVVLTRQAAQNLFGATHVVGRSIALYGNIDATVTGVIDRIPDPSHMGESAAAPLRFDVLASRDVYENLVRAMTGGRDTTQLPVDWYNGANATYVLLPADRSFTAEQLRDELPAFVVRHVPESQRRRTQFELDAVPVGDLLGMAVRDALFPQQSAVSVPLLLLTLGGIVLAVACINFANLATAKAAGRAREVGVRKAIGARPAQVAMQHLLEAGVLTAIALVIALVLVVWLMPLIESSTGMDLRSLWSTAFTARAIVSLLALGACVTLAAGAYPAIVLSRVQPAQALRGGPIRESPRSLIALLVGVQFTFAAFLLIAVTIVHEQNERLQDVAREIAGDLLLVIENSPEITGVRPETLRQELLRLPQVSSATSMEVVPWTNVFTRMPLAATPSATAVQRTALLYVVGYDFFETFDIDLIAGRVFDPQREDDVAMRAPGPPRSQNLVISRALATELGFDSPSAAVGRTIYIPASLTGEIAARPYHIIGVVADRSLTIASRYGARPNVFLFNPTVRFQVVRLASTDIRAGLAAIDATWRQLAPGFAPSRRFLADYFDESYANFSRLNQAFTGLAAIAWVISTIGLYAMAILVSGRRLREIAIRKALGARRGQIVVLLLKSFTAPVLIANIIAWPFAYVAGRLYLDVFLEPISLGLWPFAVALIVSLAIAWIAVGRHTWRAASSAPAQVMRYE